MRPPSGNLEFLFHYVKRYRTECLFMLMFVMIWSCHTTFIPYSLKILIDRVDKFYSEGFYESTSLWSFAFFPICFAAILPLTRLMNFRLLNYTELRLFPAMQTDVRVEVTSYVIRHSHQFFQDNLSGTVAGKIISLANEVKMIIMISIKFLTPASMSMIVGTILMYTVHPLFAVIMVFWAISFLIFCLILSKTAQKPAEVFASATSAFSGKVTDTFNNINNVRSFAAERYECSYIKRHAYDLKEKAIKLQRSVLGIHFVQSIAIGVVMISLVLALIYLRERDLITLGDFGFIIMLSKALAEDVWFLSTQLLEFIQQYGMYVDDLSIIKKDYDIIDDPKSMILIPAGGYIEYQNVNFNYGDKKALFDINLSIKAGEKIGIVGFSGAGKSTFINLLTRNFDLTDGRILIDGQDISLLTQDSLRSNIVLVPQDIMLFYRSIEENVKYPNREVSDKEFLEALKISGCDEFVESLPDKEKSLVGERGIKLSTGQRQRISIARSILNKSANIIVLDEATSALDSLTEKKIQDGISKMIRGRTTIAIAHRLSTLSILDRILVFDKGRIIEDGSHDELLALGGMYKRLWDMQSKGFLPTGFED